MDRQAQCLRLRTLLESYGDFWVPLPTILDLRIANYRARISELRKQGVNVVNRKERTAEGTLRSWYRIEANA